jgi:MFS family permease
VVYSVGTALCGFTQSATQLLLCRVLLGLGMGGEWACGASLVAETWPAIHRGKALAVVQSAWAVGYAAAAAVVGLILPRFGWRAVFFAGILPALVSLWIRRGLREPEVWRSAKTTRLRFSVLFRGAFGYSVLVCATMNAAALFGYWGLFTWLPRFLSMSIAEGGRGLNILQTSAWTIVMQMGTFLGYLSFGFLADRYNRKYTYIGFLIVAALLVPLFAFVNHLNLLLFIGPFVGFFGTGYFAGFSVISSELFPASLRASAMGFVYNSGRVLSAAAPYLIGRVSEFAGLNWALCMTSAAFLIAALIATALRPPAMQILDGETLGTAPGN